MNSLEISDDLAQTIYDEAQVRGLSVGNFLKDLLQRERTLAERAKIEQEQAWWFSLPLSERAKYEGKLEPLTCSTIASGTGWATSNHQSKIVEHLETPRWLIFLLLAVLVALFFWRILTPNPADRQPCRQYSVHAADCSALMTAQ